jgi:hypothetical protein
LIEKSDGTKPTRRRRRGAREGLLALWIRAIGCARVARTVLTCVAGIADTRSAIPRVVRIPGNAAVSGVTWTGIAVPAIARLG